MTEMGCDPALHDQDEWLSQFLGSDPQIALDGDELTLTSGGVTITLLDREVADPDLPLVGTTWTVTSIISGDAVSTVPDGAEATFEFADDGTVWSTPVATAAPAATSSTGPRSDSAMWP